MAMSRDGRFWRNVTLIALAHVALIAGLIHWSVEARSAQNAQSIVWLGDVGGASAATEPATGEPPPAKFSPSPQPTLLKADEAEKEKPLLAAAKSEIELPTPAPTPTSMPKPTASPAPKKTPTPAARPKATPKQIVKPAPKKTLVAKPSPKPAATPKASPEKANAEWEKKDKITLAKKDSVSQSGSGQSESTSKAGSAGGRSSGSEFGWYGNMLHDRFYSAWIQPTTNVPSGTKISTLVNVRIEKDGRVSKFEIAKPSGNATVNESVAAVAKQISQVDPPPTGLIKGDHYDVKINFELNTGEQ
jgi:TonB family protein